MRSETTKVVGLAGALVASVFVAACGDEAVPDARIPQPPIDVGGVMPPDATVEPPDAAGPDVSTAPTFSGTISIQEVSVNGVPQLGQGMQVTISFSNNQQSPAPVFEEMPGSLFGCKVWEYTAAEAADVGLNEGSVQITAMDGDPVMPPCNYVPTRGYLCIGGAGAGGDVALVSAPMGLWSLTDPEITNAALQVGSYVTITGATTPANNGNFPIVSSAGANTIVYANPNPAALPETLPATATFTMVAGVGPIPGMADPGFLEDDDVLDVTLTSGGDGHFETFTRSFPAAGGGVGDDFSLDTASQTTISDIPVDGSTFTIGCGGAGGSCGTSVGSILTITTTDGTIPAGVPPYYMPAPTTTEVSLRCANLGATELTVPAAASAFLQSSGATRIQTTFIRSNLQTTMNAPGGVVANTTLVAGHGVVGFSTP
jgi:hypothetical protein